MASLAHSIWLPVTCPKCGQMSRVEFPVLVVLIALTQWNQLALHASCHEVSWDASPVELEQIRTHVGPGWIAAKQPLLQAAPPELG